MNGFNMMVNSPGEILRDVNEKLLIASIEQHELAEIARQAEARLAALINGVEAIICEVNIATGDILFLSAQIESFLGYPHGTCNRRGFWRRVILPEDRRHTVAYLRGAIRLQHVFDHEFRVVTADGRVMWVRNRAVVVADADGAPAYLQCVIVDVSAQKRIEFLQAELLEREKRITEHLQRPLRIEFAEDAFPDLRFAAWYEPALKEAEVGGDFYDIFTVGAGIESRTVVCIGDVVGKGLPAAALAARLKDLVHAYAFESSDPADILRRLNNYQCHLAAHDSALNSRTLAGVMIAVIDCEQGTLTVAGAGMEPIMVISASGTVRELRSEGVTIGIQADELYGNIVIHAAPDDTFLMTTDGLTEARRGKEFLGYDGLIAVTVQHVNAATLTEMGNAIVRDARAFGGAFSDDVCLVLMRCVKPPVAPTEK